MVTDYGWDEKEIEVDVGRRPVLQIPTRFNDRLMAYTRALDVEISGMGCVVQDATSNFIIKEIYLPTQTSSYGSTEIDKGSLGDWIKKRKTGEGINLLWHSHVNFSVFESGVDLHTAGNTLADFSGEWMVSLIINQSNEFHAVLYLRKPISVAIPMDVSIITPPSSNTGKWEKEARDRVNKESSIAVAGGVTERYNQPLYGIDGDRYTSHRMGKKQRKYLRKIRADGLGLCYLCGVTRKLDQLSQSRVHEDDPDFMVCSKCGITR